VERSTRAYRYAQIRPRDPEEPPIHEAFATAPNCRLAPDALVGGIGSGKTTALLLTQERLKRYKDAVNLFIDAVEFTDFSETNPVHARSHRTATIRSSSKALWRALH